MRSFFKRKSRIKNRLFYARNGQYKLLESNIIDNQLVEIIHYKLFHRKKMLLPLSG